MCGIFAYVGKKDVSIEPCLTRMVHRGPDHKGVYRHKNVSLGHCRLSIIDVSNRSNQPMTSVSGRSVITFNGEIYNYKELRLGLAKEGSKFATESDTEVILEGYERHGTEFFERMRGMWAFVLYDTTNGELICARDPFGIKPLFYAIRNGEIYFTSEIKCLKETGISLEPNTVAYNTFYNLGYFIAPDTSYKDVFNLCSGEVLSWNIEKALMRPVRRVSRFIDRPKLEGDGSYGSAVDALDIAFTESVEAHYVSDVPVSILLSGGNDSSLIAALSKKLGKQPVAYHVAVPGSEDTYYATRVAQKLGLSLVIEELSQQALTTQYEKIWDILDEPTSDISIIPTSLIYEKIKGYAKVVLSGEGGDELFGGYRRHNMFMMHTVARRANILNSFFNALLSPEECSLTCRNPLVHRARAMLLYRGIPDDLIGAYLKEARIIGYPIGDAMVRQTLFDLYTRDADSRILPSLIFDMVSYLPNDLLYKTDCASMASSIEARVPFVDRYLYGETSSIMQTINAQTATDDKRILKDVLIRYLPPELVNRAKSGFGVPIMSYDTQIFMSDFASACEFHLHYSDIFAVHSDMVTLIETESSRKVIASKYPRFAFALISNWKTHA